TDDPAHALTVLTLKAVLPEVLEINPIFVYWKKDEAVTPKTILVHANKVVAVNQLNVSSSNPDFQTKVERVGNGEFKIDVAPKETTYPMFTRLTIQPENLAKTFYANARVTDVPLAR